MTRETTPTLVPDPDSRVDDLRRERDWYQARAVELDEQVFVLRSLLQSGKGFSEILKIDDLLDAFMAVCRERCGVRSSAVLLKDDLDPDAVFYRVRAFHNLPKTYVAADGCEEELLLFRLPCDQGRLWQQIRQGDLISVRDMRGAPRFRIAWDKWGLGVLDANIWCPLIKGGEVLGLLVLGASEHEEAGGRAMRETERLFLQEICAVAATNIDSTLKYEKNFRILRNIQTLYDINQQLASVNDFKQLTIETLSTAVEAMNAQKANLMLFNAETGRLEIKVVWGNIPEATRDAINNGDMPTRTFALGEGVAGQAAESRRPVRLNHRSKIAQVGRNLVHCILSVPLIHGGVVVGAITLTNKVKTNEQGERVLDPLGRFAETDSQLALGLADQAAVNLHKARLYDASITDRLTGLKNTRHFEEQLAKFAAEAASSGAPLSLAVTDIDFFKRFNDTYGHKAGDLVLREMAQLLNTIACSAGRAMAFRYGGEEFCVLFPGMPIAEAARHMEAWRTRVEAARPTWESHELSVTASVGLGEYPGHCATIEELFVSADHALYAAKEGGRNRAMAMIDGTPRAVLTEPTPPQARVA